MWKIYVWLLGYLSVETGSDIRKKEISVISSFICGSAALLLRIVMGLLRPQADAVQFLLTAILPGCVLLLIGKITRQEIGYGDGILLLVCGLCLGGKNAILLFVSGLFLMFPVSLILLLSGKADRRAELPFAPFLLAAYLCGLMQTQL